jgi:hypothetical protein
MLVCQFLNNVVPQQCHFEDVHSRSEKFMRVLVVEAAEWGRKENVKII